MSESGSTSMVISDDDDFQPAKKYSFYSQLSRSSSHSIDTRISESSDDEDFKPSSPKKKCSPVEPTPSSSTREVISNLIWLPSYEALKSTIASYESETITKYNKVQETSNFSKDISMKDISPNSKIRIQWEDKTIPFTGFPYINVGSCIYQCHQGKDYNLVKKNKKKAEVDELKRGDHVFIKSRKHTQPTKKMNCPVSFSVKKIIVFDEMRFKTDTTVHNDNSRKTRKISGDIRLKMSNKSEECKSFGKLQYVIKLPLDQRHEYHNLGEAAGLIEPLDDRVTDYLKEEIRKGCRTIKDLENRAKHFVQQNILTLDDNPDFYRRRYTPSRRKIRNIINSVKLKLQYSKVDQENVEHLSQKWRKWGDLLFEPLIKKVTEKELSDGCVENENDDGDEDELFRDMIRQLSTDSTEGKMMFVYQSKKMKHMYRRYAPSLICLDATYKTTKYSLPLFFLVVRTNVNFQVVGVMVLQEETTAMIQKGLQVFRDINPDIHPKYAIVDFDEKEIAALENVFSGIFVFLCDFHREQAWHRWISKSENGVTNIAEQVKVYLRKIAHAINEIKCNEAVSEFLKWEFCSGKLLQWFHKTWLPEVKRWSLAFRPNDLMFNNTNNGTERLNEDLKYDELASYKRCSLSEMLTVVIEQFIPKHYRRYVELNVRYSEGFKKYDENIPKYLTNRPQTLVKPSFHLTIKF